MSRFIRKNILFFLFLGFLIAGCTSSQNQIQNPSDDATIKYIYVVENDSSPNASSASFRIENENEVGFIYNEDSLPHGTKIDSLYLQITFGSSLGYIINDTISESNYYSTATTLTPIDFTKPVKIKNLATDGSTTKEYNIELRVHKVETYLHTWAELTPAITAAPAENQKAVQLNDKFLFFQNNDAANSLYTSTDAVNWEKQTAPQGLPANPKLRGLLVFNNKIYLLHNGNEIYHSVDGQTWEQSTINGDADYNYETLLFSFKDRLWAVAQHKADNSIIPAYSNDGINWTFGGKTPFFNNFPVSDFAATHFEPQIGPDKVVVIGGISASGQRLNTIWSAENNQGADTLKWFNLNASGKQINEVSLAAIESYGNKLLMFSGVSNTLDMDTTQLRHSINEGMNWVVPDTLINRIPEGFTHRNGASLIHNTSERTLYVIGGKSKTSPLSDVWKIKVNFYDFDDYDPLNSKY